MTKYDIKSFNVLKILLLVTFNNLVLIEIEKLASMERKGNFKVY